MNRNHTLVLVSIAVLVGLSSSNVSAAIINIGLGDFTNPVVLDFTAATPGTIGSNDPIFTSAGIANASVTGGQAGSDTYDVNTGSGRALASVAGSLSIIDVGDNLDDGNALPLPLFAFDFLASISRFGFNIIDQGGSYSIDFLSGGSSIGMTTFTGSSSTNYFESTIAFDRVEITHTSLTGGYGLDNLTLEAAAVPEPTAIVLIGLGLAGVGWSRRKYSQ